ncbi:MAG: hypothetical protein IPN19_09205 [Elusimicrobia bacterium]|nr:hypothetical protein [Elusimicrobiota bacterium]
MTPSTVTVDLGGTRLRLAWMTGAGIVMGWEQTAVPPSDLPKTLARIWKKKKWGQTNRLIVGSKGIWTGTERLNLQHALQGLAKTVTVVSDVELALHTAFVRTPPKTNRILIVAGTGSIAVGTNKTGTLYRAGGLGPGKGDEGSGYWIGKEFLRNKRAHRADPRPLSPQTVKKIAAQAKKVIDQSRHNPQCAALVRSAQSHLADLIIDVHRQMGGQKTVWISWAGSLMSNKRFRTGVRAFARSPVPGAQRWLAPSDSPARTAARHPDKIPLIIPRTVGGFKLV